MVRTGASPLGFLLVAAVMILPDTAIAGRIVVANDEWTLSNTGYSAPNDPAVFAGNVADWFTGGGAGTFRAYSNNFGLTGTLLAGSMTGAGHTWATGTAGFAFTLANLLNYDGIFLAGDAADNQVLIDYVEAGGNVYLAGGTGQGGAAAEAARWNTFLNHFGLGFGAFYNGVGGSLAVASPHPIFAGVDHLYQNNGNDALDIATLDPAGQVLITGPGGHGLYAVYEAGVAVPEPATLALLLAGLGLARRRGRPSTARHAATAAANTG